MKVMLLTPPGKTTERWPPLGLLYIAACIRKQRGDSIRVVDAFCMNLDRPGLLEIIKNESPDFIGISTSTHAFLESMEVLGEASAALPDATLALGGYHATFAAERILRTYPFVDYVLKGEAERSMPDLLDCIESGREPANVEGISYLNGDAYVSNRPALIENLDELPFPDRGFVRDVDYGYAFRDVPLTFGKFTTLSTSRGCPYQCSYCSCASFSRRRLRYRSAENVAQELQMLYLEGYENVVIVDDNFTHDPRRVEEICGLIRNKGIRMKLYCEGRVNKATPELLKKMKSAGFDVIYFGAESASKHVLDYYNKRATPEQTMDAVKNAKDAGMMVITSFIMGAPVESAEDMQRTVDLISRLRPHGVQVNILDVLIGTRLWEDMLTEGRIKPEDWKTNHRIYEYTESGHSRETLERFVNKGYGKYIDSWKSPAGVTELAGLLTHNRTARGIIYHNLFNPHFWSAIGVGLKTGDEAP
jgi:anaerobic magnesium-protoporphyrin IX monomethyl ester cyclase